MKYEHKVLIWQDNKDKDRYHVGVKYLGGNVNLWSTFYCDGLAEVFGKDVLDYASEGGEIVVEIKTRIVPQ